MVPKRPVSPLANVEFVPPRAVRRYPAAATAIKKTVFWSDLFGQRHQVQIAPLRASGTHNADMFAVLDHIAEACGISIVGHRASVAASL